MSTNELTHTSAELDEARAWIADCYWGDLDSSDVPELTDRQIVRGVDRHYDGGWDQFIQDAA